jgi:hypothetical protein
VQVTITVSSFFLHFLGWGKMVSTLYIGH